ncbi:MAG: hypothetical protein F6K41_05350 [Symploca sp. SIO3E6]|nr:hypothetical protein [Caldora sp. SIO3E6]
MKFERYQAYKESEVEWLCEVPKHWLPVRIKDVIRKIDQGWSPNAENRTVEKREWGVLKLSAINNGKYYEINHKALPDTTGIKNQYIVRTGDLLITRSNTPELVGDCGLVLVEPIFNLMYSDLIYCLKIKSNKILDRYLNYFLCTTSFRWLKTVSARGLNTSMVKISQGIICRWNIFSPPLPEQKAIAQYLDTKTAQIDHKIDLLTQKAQRYEELKRSLINETVTRGLDKSVPMKDSGVEWLGQIPEHWEIKRLKDLSTLIIDGTHFTPDYTSHGIRFLSVNDITRKPFDLNQSKFISPDAHKGLIKRCRPKKGDILLSKNGTIGVPLLIDFDEEVSIYVSLCLIKITPQVNARYSYYSFLASFMFEQYNLHSKTNSVTNLHLDKLRNFFQLCPPLSEQKAIATYLDTKTAQIDQIIQTINSKIEKLKELRKTLINDVVTGKIKVASEA